MKKFLVLAGISAALVFTSCSKDNDKPGDNGNGNAPQKRIKKMTKTEDGVTTVYNFNYDNNKRLTGFASTSTEEATVFTYDANNNLTKVESTEDGFHNIYTYTWNNGKPVSGTFRSYDISSDEVDNLVESDDLVYTLTNNQVSRIKLTMHQEDADAVVNFDLTYTNGNVSKVQADQNGLYTATFVFGNKKSPFPQISNYVLDQAGFSLFFTSRNELKSAVYDFPGTQLDENVNQQYTYDNDGYPLTSNDGETLLKYEYQ